MTEQRFNKAGFDEKLASHKLMASRCEECGRMYLPPKPMCTNCYSDNLEWVEAGTNGTLEAFTIVYIASTAMIEAGYGRENPHCSGIVKLENGLSISAQILGVNTALPETIKIGAPVEAVFLERGEGEEKKTFLAFDVK
ncbi:MAG: Zn-ribbon domain-containing OB-fold protein [Anaerolineales bacterium]|nr:Zn-ribbon domain-containing OB-fold protein [Anaerolineales bacterium]